MDYAFRCNVVKYEQKSQYANYSSLPLVSFLRSSHSEAPQVTQRGSATFSLVWRSLPISRTRKKYIPLNRPESGGTVPISTTLSRCPAEHSTCPDFIRRRSVIYSPRRVARAQETAGHTRTFLLPCLHEQRRLTIFYIAMQAGMCVICLHTKNGIDRSHGKNVRGFLRACAHIFVPIFGQKFPNLHKCGPSLCS